MGTFKLKLLVFGAEETRKTKIVKKHIKGSFSQDYKMTIGTDVYTKDVIVNDGQDTINLGIWDIASQERFDFIRSSFYRGGAGALLFIDVTNYQTFYPLLFDFLNDVWRIMGHNIPTAIFGTNTENDDIREISRIEMKLIAQQIFCHYYEYVDEKMEDIFQKLSNEMLVALKKRYKKD